jgi:hypothetical protein
MSRGFTTVLGVFREKQGRKAPASVVGLKEAKAHLQDLKKERRKAKTSSHRTALLIQIHRQQKWIKSMKKQEGRRNVSEIVLTLEAEFKRTPSREKGKRRRIKAQINTLKRAA